jgi:hypothetical protein
MLEQFQLDHFAGRASLVQQNVAHTNHPCKLWQEYGHDTDKIDKDNRDFHEADRSLRNELQSLPRIHKRAETMPWLPRRRQPQIEILRRLSNQKL